MEINIRVHGQDMEIRDGMRPSLAPYSQEFIRLNFSLSNEWYGLKTFCQFNQNSLDKPINVYLDSGNSAYVPEAIRPGRFSIMLYGVKDVVIGTTHALQFTMVRNGYVSDATETELTESLYQQLIDDFKQYLADTTAQADRAASAAHTAANDAASKAESTLSGYVSDAKSAADIAEKSASQAQQMITNSEFTMLEIGSDGWLYETRTSKSEIGFSIADHKYLEATIDG